MKRLNEANATLHIMSAMSRTRSSPRRRGSVEGDPALLRCGGPKAGLLR